VLNHHRTLETNIIAADDLPTDGTIADAAERALAWNTAVPLGSVRIAVRDGRVRLTGTLTWPYQRRAAEAAVGHLPGVQEVRNDIVVRREVTAREIHARIAQTFRQLAETSASRVKVELRDGEATLTGTVRSAEERREAERAALGAPNVSVVNDRLVVTS
jgi:osmotically-inducible protein OsmY